MATATRAAGTFFFFVFVDYINTFTGDGAGDTAKVVKSLDEKNDGGEETEQLEIGLGPPAASCYGAQRTTFCYLIPT